MKNDSNNIVYLTAKFVKTGAYTCKNCIFYSTGSCSAKNSSISCGYGHWELDKILDKNPEELSDETLNFELEEEPQDVNPVEPHYFY